jgi:hypothetical protein
MYTGATVQLDTRSQKSRAPASVSKPDDLSFERRSDMRFEYAHYKKGGNMDLKTATPHHSYIKFKDGFTTLLAQIKDGVWWTDSQRESVQDSLLNMRRLGDAIDRCVMVYDVPCETSVCGLDVKDVLTSWLKDS